MIKLNKTIQVYDCFERWTNFENIYLYGDPHFGDLESYQLRFPDIETNRELLNKIIDKDKKQFDIDVVKELDEMQIKNINRVCGKRDILIILGDVGNIKCVKKLKAGYKVLILGNHDRGYNYYKREIKEVEHNSDICPKCGGPVKYDGMTLHNCGFGYAWCPKCGTVEPKDDKYEDNHLFDEVYEGTLQINPKIMLSHEPIEYKYCLNIHGHNHFGPTCNNKVNVSKEGHFNAIAEAINYKPISLAALLQKGLASNIPDIHRETIDRASKK